MYFFSNKAHNALIVIHYIFFLISEFYSYLIVRTVYLLQFSKKNRFHLSRRVVDTSYNNKFKIESVSDDPTSLTQRLCPQLGSVSRIW